DLGPPCTYRLTCPGRRQYCELERSGRDGLLLAYRNEKGWNLGVWQCDVVFDLAHFRARRQQLVEMAAPARRVLARAIPTCLRPIQDGLDTPAHAARGLGFRRPDRLQDLEDQRGIDRLHRERADQGLSVGGERG